MCDSKCPSHRKEHILSHFYLLPGFGSYYLNPAVLIYLHFIKRRAKPAGSRSTFCNFTCICAKLDGAMPSANSTPLLLSLPQLKKKKKKSMWALNSLQRFAGFMGQLLLIGFPWRVHNLCCRDASFPLAASVRVGTKSSLKYNKCDEM